MTDHQRTGAEGEQLACQWLEEHGFRILHRNWRHRRDELDVVALDGPYLVVVEVKTLTSDRWARPEDAVNPTKQRKLMRAAAELVQQTPGDLELRFDVISVTFAPGGPQILHIPDAFYPTLDEQAQ